MLRAAAHLVRLVRRFAGDRQGLALVEFAAVLPILVVMLFGGFETTRYILVQLKLDRTATSMADLISQLEGVSEAQITDMYEAAEDIMLPFDLAADGRVIVSNVYRPTSSAATVQWQRASTGGLASTSQIGAQGATATLPNGLTLAQGEDVIVAEVFYQYQPTLVDWFFDTAVLYQIAFYRPRFDGLTTVSP
jgi:Flp pilus assembly protein TadG